MFGLHAIIFLILGIVFLVLASDGLRSGVVAVRGLVRGAARHESPLTYWFYVGLYVVIGFGSTLLGVYLILFWAR
jgi:hypothetical protein